MVTIYLAPIADQDTLSASCLSLHIKFKIFKTKIDDYMTALYSQFDQLINMPPPQVHLAVALRRPCFTVFWLFRLSCSRRMMRTLGPRKLWLLWPMTAPTTAQTMPNRRPWQPERRMRRRKTRRRTKGGRWGRTEGNFLLQFVRWCCDCDQVSYLLSSLCRRRGGGFGPSVTSVGGGSVACLCWRLTARPTSLKPPVLTRPPPRLRPTAPRRRYAAQTAARGSHRPPASTATSGPSTPGTGPKAGRSPGLNWKQKRLGKLTIDRGGATNLGEDGKSQISPVEVGCDVTFNSTFFKVMVQTGLDRFLDL